MSKTLIIAEAGVNHNGDMEIAKRLIDAAAEAGVDFVKFQTFKANEIVSKEAPKAEYQVENTGNASESQYEMIKKLELSEENHEELIEYCNLKGVNFLSTAFDLPSIDLLNELDIALFKIPSGEITNLPYLRKIAATNKKIILSTGMANMEEIGAALAVLKENNESRDVTVLHCNTEYPTPMEHVNLNAMHSIQETYDVAIGYSDHTLGIEVPIAAVALGATVIEKHFTLSREMEGPDHAASLEPDELKHMVSAIRNIEMALGSAAKETTDSERKNIPIARKSVHLAEALEAGHTIQESDLVMKRPGNGISPMDYEQLLGRVVRHSIPKDHLLSWDDFE